jgi:hypothetical protein
LIAITQTLARHLRAVLRRTPGTATRLRPPVVFRSGPDGLLIHSQQEDIAVAYRQSGSFASESVALPGQVLKDVEGNGNTPVQLELVGPGQCLVRWEENGVPRAQDYDTVDLTSVPPVPAAPKEFVCPGPDFLTALDQALQTVRADAVRPALARVQLRSSGGIVGSDGWQLLLQGGFTFPWAEDLLIPKTGVFGYADVSRQQEVLLGRTDSHVVVQAGPWSVYLPIDRQPRYPRAEDVIPRLTSEVTHWRLSPEDADFLRRSLPKLPGEDGDDSPVTVDLGERVAVRARALGQERGTELVLTGSTVTGKAVTLHTQRRFLLRALQLGFTTFAVVKAEAPVQCQEGQRTYVWVPLASKGALAPSEHDLQISSGGKPESAPISTAPIERRAPPVTTPQKNGHAADPIKDTPVAAERPEGGCSEDVVQQTQELQGVLRDVLTRTSRLLQALKQQRKHSRLMRATLSSLRQLQQVAD